MYVFYGLIVLLLFSISVYLIFFRKRKQPTESADKSCTIYFFYTVWCPVCKRTRPEWDKFKSEWNDKSLYGYRIDFKEVDCDLNESVANTYNVSKYPCVKLVKNDEVYDFDAKVSVESLTQFITTILTS
jgi:thiol-disulfide isomerase/thioredoxin